MKRLLIIILLTLVPAIAAHADFYDPFEGATSETLNADWTQHEAFTDRVTITTNKFRAGSKSVRFYWVNGDPLVQNGHRAELQLANNSIGLSEFWYGISINDGDRVTYNSWDLMNQWHSGVGDCAGPSPPMALQNGGTDGKVIQVMSRGPTTCSTNPQTHVVGNADTNADKWIDYVFHIKFNQSGAGLLQIYMDGVLVNDDSGMNIGYSDAPNNYFKIGIYT